MEKKAYFMRGNPQKNDNQFNYNRGFDRDLNIMKDLAEKNGYSVEFIGDNSFVDQSSDTDTLFYYVGHANDVLLRAVQLNQLFLQLKEIVGRKL